MNNTYAKSPIFYMGNKYRLLPQLMSLFPQDINCFYDIFGGSGVVSANINSKNIIYNEFNENIINIYKLFLKYTPEEINTKINNYIKEYDLNREGTDIRQNNPNVAEERAYYNKNYIRFRKAYNESQRDYIMLYTLTFYSFSNLIRFNQKNEFNMPYGNRCYCNKHYEIIKNWNEVIKNKNIIVKNENAFDILENEKFANNDFIYLDPPYSNTMAIYNEKRAFGGWTVEDDIELFKVLDELDAKGIKWGLSNVFKNKDIVNSHLIEWSKKYNVEHLNINYSSLGKGNAHTDEVYVYNYLRRKND